ncbi:MAG: hypothetical protein QM811_17690 [Pirellulales bacterium]
MEARGVRSLLAIALGFTALVTTGAGYKTPNFVVTAPTQEMAEKVGRAAEKYRHSLAVMWVGKPMPDWRQPCPIMVDSGPRTPPNGETSFVFDRGEVFGWKMVVRGNEERILDSVLPHEVTHTVFASYFRRPMPRWADEGACTTMEHESERNKQHRLLYEFLRTDRGIAFTDMFVMKQYPREILTLYAQGYAVTRYLIQRGGRAKFMEFLGEGMQGEQWTAAVQKHYGHRSISELQQTWVAWVEEGCPELKTVGIESKEGPPLELVAWNDRRESGARGREFDFRGQSPDDAPRNTRETVGLAPQPLNAPPANAVPQSAAAPRDLVPLAAAEARNLNDLPRSPGREPDRFAADRTTDRAHRRHLSTTRARRARRDRVSHEQRIRRSVLDRAFHL